MATVAYEAEQDESLRGRWKFPWSSCESLVGCGHVPELQKMIAATPFAEARVRPIISGPQMHLHLARAGVGMTFLANWASTVFPELQRVPGTKLDQHRSTWALLHGGVRRVQRAHLLVDYLSTAMLERLAEFIG